MEEYIVTLKSYEDLEAFYEDMETEGGNLYIPNRLVDCSLRRPTSRNTLYYLTGEEAEQLKADDRVQHVIKKSPREAALHAFERTGRFDKSQYSPPSYSTSTSWSLLRTRLKYNEASSVIDNWYPEFPNGGSGSTIYVDDTITATESGENVDIIIVDYGSVLPSHPEFAVNLDGTGASRVQEINWHQYTPTVQGDNPGLNATNNFLVQNYVYTPYSTGNQATDEAINHGASCASLAAGTIHGSAFKANIYNISTFESWLRSNGNISLNGSLYFTLFDYIRAFHNNKAINPATGTKNPTIVSGSFGYITTIFENGNSWPYYARTPTSVYGSTTNTTYRLTPAQMEAAQICAASEISGSPGSYQVTLQSSTLDLAADVQDAIDDGIHVFVSAGNSNQVLEPIGTPVYNGTYFENLDNNFPSPYYYKHRNFSPNASIVVGALSGTREGYNTTPSGRGEMPDYYSSRGNGVDIYSPASGCCAATNSDAGFQIADPRDNSYYFGVFGGTSAACPNVAGIAACILERFPDFTPAQLKEYLLTNFSRDRDTQNEIGDDNRAWPGIQPSPAPNSNNFGDNYSFHPDETPRTVNYVQDIRPISGRCETKEIYGVRKSSGRTYPRSKVCRTYRKVT